MSEKNMGFSKDWQDREDQRQQQVDLKRSNQPVEQQPSVPQTLTKEELGPEDQVAPK